MNGPIIRIRDIAGVIEDFAPLYLQEDYDNCGLNLGNYRDRTEGALLTLDVTERVLEEAMAKGANLIISHHPLLFHPLKNITDSNATQRIVRKALTYGLSVYCAHTNLDNAPGGMSWHLGSKLGLKDMKVLVPDLRWPEAGLGVVGELDEEMWVDEFFEFIKSKLGCRYLRHSDVCVQRVGKVALSTGSGGSLIKAAMEQGVEVFVSSDFRYNDFYVPDRRIVAIDAGHFETEYCAVELLFDIIRKKLPTFALHKSETSVNPVNYI